MCLLCEKAETRGRATREEHLHTTIYFLHLKPLLKVYKEVYHHYDMKKDVALALIIFIVSAFLLFDKLTAAHLIQIIV